MQSVRSPSHVLDVRVCKTDEHVTVYGRDGRWGCGWCENEWDRSEGSMRISKVMKRMVVKLYEDLRRWKLWRIHSAVDMCVESMCCRVVS